MLEEIKQISAIVKNSGITRESFDQIALKAIVAKSFGLEPIQGIFGIDLIQTKNGLQLFMKPILMEALVRASKRYRYTIVELTEEKCVLDWYEKTNEGMIEWKKTGTIEYTIEEAEKQELTQKPGWKRTPKEMLFYRCFARAVRFLASDVIFGMPIYLSGVEEWTDVEAEIVDEKRAEKINEILREFNDYMNIIDRLDDDDEEIEFEKVAKRFEVYGLNPHKVWNFFYNNERPTKYLVRVLLGFFGLQKNQEPNIEVIEKIKEVI